MAVLTEAQLRARYNKEKFSKINIDEFDKLTPSAKEFLNAKSIEVVINQEIKTLDESPKATEEQAAPKIAEKKFHIEGTQAWMEYKPVFMTEIEGKSLVYKDDDRIIFRSKLDCLQAEMLYSMAMIKPLAKDSIYRGLEEVFNFTKAISRAEKNHEHLEEITVLSLSGDLIWEYIDKSEIKYGVEGFNIEENADLSILILNRLRAQARELETFGIKCNRLGCEVKRQDLVRGLNQLCNALRYLVIKSF